MARGGLPQSRKEQWLLPSPKPSKGMLQWYIRYLMLLVHKNKSDKHQNHRMKQYYLFRFMAASRESGRHQLSFPGTVRGPTNERICELCHQHHHRLSSPLKWRSEEARKYVISQQVKSDSLICKPCQDDNNLSSMHRNLPIMLCCTAPKKHLLCFKNPPIILKLCPQKVCIQCV